MFGNVFKGIGRFLSGKWGRKEMDARYATTTVTTTARDLLRIGGRAKRRTEQIVGAFGGIVNKGRAAFRLLGTPPRRFRLTLRKPSKRPHECRFQTVSKMDGVRLLVRCRGCGAERTGLGEALPT